MFPSSTDAMTFLLFLFQEFCFSLVGLFFGRHVLGACVFYAHVCTGSSSGANNRGAPFLVITKDDI